MESTDEPSEGANVELLHRLPATFKQELDQLYDEDAVVSVLPCTPLQEAMLSVDDPSSNGSYYNQIVFGLHGDVERLKTAWQVMVKRHSILRTRFLTGPDRRYPFVQVILNESPLPWSHASTDDLSTSVLARHAKTSPISALNDTEPPYAFTVYHQRNGDEQALVLSAPHAIYDSASLAIMLEEVQAAYHEIILEDPVPFTHFLEHVHSSYSGAARQYWKRHLQDFEPTAFPDLTGKSTATRSSLSGHEITDHQVHMPLSHIQTACKEQNVTITSICQSAWTKVLLALTGELDICIGNVVSGRTVDVNGLDKLVAPCFNTIPMRVSIEDDTTNAQLVEKLRSSNADSLEYQLSPLRQIQNDNCESRQPLFDTLIIMQQAIEQLDTSIWSFKADLGIMDVGHTSHSQIQRFQACPRLCCH